MTVEAAADWLPRGRPSAMTLCITLLAGWLVTAAAGSSATARRRRRQRRRRQRDDGCSAATQDSVLARNLHVAWSGWSWRARALIVEAAASSRPLGRNVLRSAADGRDGTLPLSAVAEVQASAAVLWRSELRQRLALCSRLQSVVVA